MDKEFQEKIHFLRKIDSHSAALWIVENYPISSINYGEGVRLLSGRSWKKNDQKLLAKYYFQKIPFADDYPYRIFSSFMSVANFVEIMVDFIPENKNKKDLLFYHIMSILKDKIKTDKDKKAFQMLIDLLSRPNVQ